MRALLLAAGVGSRLKPYTNFWPKCLMPVHGRPLLEYWLSDLFAADIEHVYVNTHHHADVVKAFLSRSCFSKRVSVIDEAELSGTAGTIRELAQESYGSKLLVAHADNWIDFDLSKLIRHHLEKQNSNQSYLMTMLTFYCDNPSNAGVVQSDDEGRLTAFFEKINDPPGNIANGAVYIIEKEIIQWIVETPAIIDFSTEVIPRFIDHIGVLHNNGIHRDIGSIESLMLAQTDPVRANSFGNKPDSWSIDFAKNKINALLNPNARLSEVNK